MRRVEQGVDVWSCEEVVVDGWKCEEKMRKWGRDVDMSSFIDARGVQVASRGGKITVRGCDRMGRMGGRMTG